MSAKTLTQRMEEKLQQAFAPQELHIINESNKHKGHKGAREGAAGESHFHVKIISDRFIDKSRLARHRLVMDSLAEDIAPGGIHALSVSAYTPQEAAQKYSA